MIGRLDQYKQKLYVSPTVLLQTMIYANLAVGEDFRKEEKTIFEERIDLNIQEDIFPILFYTDAGKELWQPDPEEYIRTLFITPCSLVKAIHTKK